MDEQIICFKKELLSAYLNRSKVFYDESLWHYILDTLQSIPRSDAENDFQFKQLIVYTLTMILTMLGEFILVLLVF